MLLPISSFAAERIDIDSNCSLTISYVDEKTPIKNAKIKAYRVMDVYENGEGDLTVFTCTIGGKSRVTVRCNKLM